MVRTSAKSTRKAKGRPGSRAVCEERCSTGGLRRTRIPVVPLSATSPVVVDDGWLYDVLRWAGVSQPTAAHWQQVVIKPLTVVMVVLVAALIWLAREPDHPALGRGRRPQGRRPTPTRPAPRPGPSP